MIEQKIDDLIASIDKNTAALEALRKDGTEKVKPVKTAVAEKAKPVKTAEPVVEEPTGPTKDEVSKAVENLLKANKRTEAIALMEKFGAKSVSTVKESDYAAFLEAADEILLAA